MPKSLKNADRKDSYKPSYSESVICTLGVYLRSNDYYSLFSSTAEDKSPGPCFMKVNALCPYKHSCLRAKDLLEEHR